MAADLLNCLIIKRILGDLGVAPPPLFGRVGITLDIFMIPEKITLRHDDDTTNNYNLFAGSLKDSGHTIKALLADISSDGVPEFVLLFRFDNLSVYGLRLAFDDSDMGLFLVSVPSEEGGPTWAELDLYGKAMALAGVECITQAGIPWNPSTDYKDLHEALLTMINFE